MLLRRRRSRYVRIGVGASSCHVCGIDDDGQPTPIQPQLNTPRINPATIKAAPAGAGAPPPSPFPLPRQQQGHDEPARPDIRAAVAGPTRAAGLCRGGDGPAAAACIVGGGAVEWGGEGEGCVYKGEVLHRRIDLPHT